MSKNKPGTRLKNRGKGAGIEHEIKKRLKDPDYALIAQQAKLSFPSLICFGEYIKLVEYKTDRIKKSDIEKMKKLIRKIIKAQPLLANIIWGQIKSHKRTVWICPELKYSIVIKQLKGDKKW